MTKYATLRKYQPYIDEILKDLDLYGKVNLNIKFGSYANMSGDMLYNKAFNLATIRVDRESSHHFTLLIFMHELRHVWQEWTGIASSPYSKQVIGKRGAIHYEWFTLWNGVEYKSYSHAVKRTHKDHKLYLSSPWEIDAVEYEKKVDKLFPNDNPPAAKKLIGVVGKIKFYKIGA